VASSSTTIGASFNIARAREIRWRCPPESIFPASPISYVAQDQYLFNTSLLENIRLGRLDATDEEVMDNIVEDFVFRYYRFPIWARLCRLIRKGNMIVRNVKILSVEIQHWDSSPESTGLYGDDSESEL